MTRTPLDGLDDAERGRVRPSAAAFVAPMLATLTQDRFTDPAWIFERKLDGVRAVAVHDGRGASLWSRSEKRMDATYPEIVDAIAARTPAGTVVDGEIVAFDGDQTSFARLQGRIGLHDPDAARASGIAVYLYLFDVLVVDDHDVTALPLRTRKRLLRDAVDFGGPLRMSTHRNTDGEAYLREACQKGWEGLVAKRADAPYRAGRRSPDWLKLKCVHEQELVVGGWTDPQRSRTGFGALLVGYFDGRGAAIRGEGRHRLRPPGARRPQRPLPRPARRAIAVRRTGPREGRALAAPGSGRADRVQRMDPRRQAPPPPLPGSARRQGAGGRRSRGARMTWIFPAITVIEC